MLFLTAKSCRRRLISLLSTTSGAEHSDSGVLVWDTVQPCRRIPTVRCNLLPHLRCTLNHNPEDHNPNSHRRTSLKCHKVGYHEFTWTIRTLRPVSLARASLTFRQGFGLTSNEALKARRCCVVRMVRGLFGPRRPSCALAAGTRSSHEYSPATVKGNRQRNHSICK